MSDESAPQEAQQKLTVQELGEIIDHVKEHGTITPEYLARLRTFDWWVFAEWVRSLRAECKSYRDQLTQDNSGVLLAYIDASDRPDDQKALLRVLVKEYQAGGPMGKAAMEHLSNKLLVPAKQNMERTNVDPEKIKHILEVTRAEALARGEARVRAGRPVGG